jgi:hypothetical protein
MSLVFEPLTGLSSLVCDSVQTSDLQALTANITNLTALTESVNTLYVTNFINATGSSGGGYFSNIHVSGTGYFNNIVTNNINATGPNSIGNFSTLNVSYTGSFGNINATGPSGTINTIYLNSSTGNFTNLLAGNLTSYNASLYNADIITLNVDNIINATGSNSQGIFTTLTTTGTGSFDSIRTNSLYCSYTGSFTNINATGSQGTINTIYLNSYTGSITNLLAGNLTSYNASLLNADVINLNVDNYINATGATSYGQFTKIIAGTGTFGSIYCSGSGTFGNYISASGWVGGGVYMVNNTMTTSQIQSVINNTAYNTIIFEPGTYILTTTLNIARSGVILDGQWCTLYMANLANAPNISIGDLSSATPSNFYGNVIIKNFNLNGNSSGQSSEYMTGKSWVTNCCIFITFSYNVWIQNNFLLNARSGGLTITYYSSGVNINNCSSYNHYFDNYTAYGSKHLFFANNYGYGCTNGGGLSIDDACQYVTVTGNIFNANKLGIFARWILDLTLTGNTCSENVQQGAFIAGYSMTGANPSTDDQGLTRWTICGNTFTNNGGAGLWCQAFKYGTINGNVITYNGSNGLVMGNDTANWPDGTCSYNSITGNTICNNTGYGVYSDPANSYTAGARYNYLTFNVIKGNSTNIGGDLSSYTLNDDTQLNSGQIYLHANSGNTCNIIPSSSGNSVITLPANNGNSGNLLTTDGSTNASWTATPSITSLTCPTINSNTIGLTKSGIIPPQINFTNGTAVTGIVGPSSASPFTTFVLPTNNGTAGQSLKTDGAGNTYWG